MPVTQMERNARRWALALTRQPSVTGTSDEAAFGPWLAGELKADPAFRDALIWTMPVGVNDPRQCVAMLLRRSGARTVILTGHYDTVSIEDYGSLRGLATEPEGLAAALSAQLADHADTPAARRAAADLASADFLPGRGLLDMKAGLAAGLAVCAAFAAAHEAEGNLLFIAVPDEENNSAGAQCAAQALPGIAREHGLDWVAVVNLDAIADDGAGEDGRAIALGTVGKLLPTAFVVGVPTHSGFPRNGINAGALAGAIAARVEWSSELTDETVGTPPSLLSLRDGKLGYDVTTPSTAFATFNVLSFRRKPDEVMQRFESLCAQASTAYLAELCERAGAVLPETIPVLRYETVEAAALSRDHRNREGLRDAARALAGEHRSLPEKCRRLTETAWMLSGLSGPAVLIGFGSIPYLPTDLSASPAARRLRDAAGQVAAAAAQQHGVSVRCVNYFPAISDMSFFGEADEADLRVVAANTPMWREELRWPASGGIAGIPTINLGPWGRDYHTPLERLHVPYAFDTLPQLLRDLASVLLKESDRA